MRGPPLWSEQWRGQSAGAYAPRRHRSTSQGAHGTHDGSSTRAGSAGRSTEIH